MEIRRKKLLTQAVLLLSPALILLALVYAYPIGRAVLQSFYAKNLSTEMLEVFVGRANYQRLFSDSRFWSSLSVTLLFTLLSLSLEIVLGLLIALVLNERFLGRRVVRTVAILPWALPTALIALAWTWVFNDQFGVVNDILMRIGIVDEPVNWLGGPTSALWALVLADVWKTTPFISVLLLAGLQSIPTETLEAYSVDGASRFQRFFAITLPLLLPHLIIASVFRFSQAFGVFDLVQVMTGGGPGGATEVISLYVYATIMRYLDFGYGAALVVVTFLSITLVLIFAYVALNLYNRRTGGGVI